MSELPHDVETVPASMTAARQFHPGIYLDIPFDEYRKLKAINASTLAWGEESAEHLKAALDGKMPDVETDAKLFGRAFHARVLEPDVYYRDYKVAGDCGSILKTGDRKGQECGTAGKYFGDGQWYCGLHCPSEKDVGKLLERVPNLLSKDYARRVEAVAKKIEEDDVARLIRQRGGFETTLMFTIADMGLESFPLDAKVRLDKLVSPVEQDGNEIWPATIVDLKKVQLGKANYHSVSWDIWKWHYDAKAAFYVDAVKRVTGQDARFIWIFIEDNYPYAVHPLEADHETLTIGRIRYSEWLGKYAVGKLTGDWPGYTQNTRIRRGGLPEKIRREMLGGSASSRWQ